MDTLSIAVAAVAENAYGIAEAFPHWKTGAATVDIKWFHFPDIGSTFALPWVPLHTVAV